MKKMTSHTEKIFTIILESLKKSNADCDQVTELFLLFKNPLNAYFSSKDSNFKIEIFFHNLIQNSLDLRNMDMKKIEDFYKKVGIFEGFDKKDFLINFMSKTVMENKKKIEELEERIKDLEERNRQSEKKIKQQIEKPKDLEEKFWDFDENNEKQNEFKVERQKIEEIVTKQCSLLLMKYQFCHKDNKNGNFTISNFN